MKRAAMACGMIVCTFILCTGMILSPERNSPVTARVVHVQRGNVRRVKAITGRLKYSDEAILYAQTSGIVSQIYAEPGQRVSAGDVLIRLEDQYQVEIAAAYAANQDVIDPIIEEMEVGDAVSSISNLVLRADDDATVRQILIEEQRPVAVGTPLMRLSSTGQQIVCSVHSKDVADIQPGQWAWIVSHGETLGLAQVTELGETEREPASGIEYRTVTLVPEKHLSCAEGSVIDAEIYLAGSDDVLTLPLEAITERQTVWWVNEGRCIEIPAEIVMSDEIRAWVNLPEGMQVAIGEFKTGQRIQEAVK